MKLRELKPGMVIHCKSDEEYNQLEEQSVKDGFGILPCKERRDANDIKQLVFYFSESPGVGWSYEKDVEDKKHIIEFSDLIITEDEYTRGLNDAWELAKKIILNEQIGGMETETMQSIFGTTLYCEVFGEYTALEALAKLEAYEKEKQIKVGDVVDHDGLKSVVVRVADNTVYAVTSFGTTPCYAMDYVKLKKTGQHIDIESILAEIGKEK